MRRMGLASIVVLAVLGTSLAACHGSISYTPPFGLVTFSIDSEGNIGVDFGEDLVIPDVGTFTLSVGETINPSSDENVILIGQSGSSAYKVYRLKTNEQLHARTTAAIDEDFIDRKLTINAIPNVDLIVYVSDKPFAIDPCLSGTWNSTSFKDQIPDGSLYRDGSGSALLKGTTGLEMTFTDNGNASDHSTGDADWRITASGKTVGGPWAGDTVSYTMNGHEEFSFGAAGGTLSTTPSSSSVTETWNGGSTWKIEANETEQVSYICGTHWLTTTETSASGEVRTISLRRATVT